MIGSNKYKIFFLIFSYLVMNMNCATSNNMKNEETKPIIYSEAHILFVTIGTQSKNQILQLDILHQSLLEGKLKEAHMDQSVLKEGDWSASVVSSSGVVREWTKIENPLVYRAEYVNDDGVLETKTINRESGNVSFRMPIEGDVQFLQIERVYQGEDQLLKRIKLSEL